MKRKQKQKFFLWTASLMLALFLFLAVAFVVLKSSGKILVGVIEDHAIPYVLQTNDVEMGCVMAKASALLIPILAQINASPYKLAVVFDFLSGSCAEFKAWEEELRYLRAIHAGNVTEAQDARILQKRYLNQAASRQFQGYRNLQLAYAEIPGTDCPDFASENEEFYWLVGLMNGLQAVMNDLASEGSAKVPLDIILQVGRGTDCLNNEKWWGLPNAIRAAIWVSFPSDNRKGIEPLDVLEQAVQTGLQQGMRIVQVVAAKIYNGLGDTDRVKNIIRDHVQARNSTSANPDFLFLEELANIQLQAISDHMWTEYTGKRTPIDELGTFWDDRKNTVDTVDIIDIL